jgi:hypothetical protein
MLTLHNGVHPGQITTYEMAAKGMTHGAGQVQQPGKEERSNPSYNKRDRDSSHICTNVMQFQALVHTTLIITMIAVIRILHVASQCQ